MGYVTWGALALIFCILRWRRLLLLAPVLVLGIVFFLPSVVDRMLFGFVENPDDPSTTQQYADYEDGQIRTLDVTSGRTLVWPLVIDKIKEGPVFGFGRDAMRNKGVSLHMATIVGSKGDVFSHPHNAYLQWILDNGVVGFSVVLLFYFLVVKYSLSLFLDSRSTTFIAAGGISAALVLGLLIASMGSQTFYPREGAVGMWCSIMLMFRIYLERAKWLGAGLIEEKSFDLFWDSNSQPTKRQRPAIS